MRPFRALVIYLVVVFIGGALLAPWLYRLAQVPAHSFPGLAAQPFHRFVDRSFLILALAGLWPLLRTLGVTSPREAGLVSPRGQGNRLLGGLLLGFLSLAAAAGMALVVGDRALAPGLNAHKIVGTVFSAAATAAAVAVLEEILFRGGIFGGLRRTFYWPLALLVSSLVYAFVHFLQPAELTGPITWNSGLALLPRLLNGFANFYTLVPGFFNLALAGTLLGLAFQRSDNLYFSIGLHAGWIFWLKAYGSLTAAVPHAATWLWGTGRLIDGWFSLFVLILILVIFPFLPLHTARQSYAIPR